MAAPRPSLGASCFQFAGVTWWWVASCLLVAGCFPVVAGLVASYFCYLSKQTLVHLLSVKTLPEWLTSDLHRT